MNGPLLRLDIDGESAMACYFLMAHCGEAGGAPTLDSESSPMAIVFALESPAVLDSIRATLEDAQRLDGTVAESARALMKVVEEKTSGIRPTGADDGARISSTGR
jgi:hypothetical protein